MPDIEYMSAEGLASLQAELERLSRIDRPEIAQRISDAADLGDLSENADYEDAKRQQAFLEGRIQTIEQLIRNAVIIKDRAKKSDKVNIGSKVTIKTGDGKEVYTIVGGHEARPAAGFISNESPVGRAMLNKKVGDEVTARTPGGDFAFKILSID